MNYSYSLEQVAPYTAETVQSTEPITYTIS